MPAQPIVAIRPEGVIGAIETLGSGFLSHPGNGALRKKLGAGDLSASDYHRQLVRVVYRVLFLLIAEERDLLHPPGAEAGARTRYAADLSVGRRQDNSAAERDPDGADLWDTFCRVSTALATPGGDPEHGLACLGSRFWSMDACADLQDPCADRAMLRNADFRGAVRLLAFEEQSGVPHPIDFQGLAPGRLGSIYEAILERRPEVDPRSGTFALRATSGSERSSTGSFYTPPVLVEHLLDSALDPVVEDCLASARQIAIEAGEDPDAAADRALLGIRVCDPACGTGHFLVAAGRRLARTLGAIRCGGADPDEQRRAICDVVRNCLYGVDRNPMAVELCKIALWMEAGVPGAPLSQMDACIMVGDSLLGTTPSLLAEGIPDAALAALPGDDRRVASYYRRRNKRERRGLRASGSAPLHTDATRELASNETPEHTRLLADAWCASFLWSKRDTDSPGALPGYPGRWDAITERVFRAIRSDPDSVRPWVLDEIRRLAGEHRFFHWRLAFPGVFTQSQDEAPGSSPGFDVIVGNPPFLNQLESSTASDRGPAAILRARSGGAIRGYADVSAAFLLLSVSITRPGGRVALVQPQSLLASKDAGPARAEVLRHGALCSLWVSNAHVFDGASVFTCAPTIHVGGPRCRALRRSAGREFRPLLTIEIDTDALAQEETWAHLAAASMGVPEIRVASAALVGDMASSTADFRDQYYGLDGFLVEDAQLEGRSGARDASHPPLVTTGLIDLAQCRWGTTVTRILKRRWQAPRIDRARMNAQGTLGAWIDQRLIPKVLIATQTRVVEAFVDADGRYVPSIPLISVFPEHPEQIWRLAAALASPVCSALAMQRYAGAALHADAIKLSARQVLKLPLPSDASAWSDGETEFRGAQLSGSDGARAERLIRFGAAMCRAYALSTDDTNSVTRWWERRVGIA